MGMALSRCGYKEQVHHCTDDELPGMSLQGSLMCVVPSVPRHPRVVPGMVYDHCQSQVRLEMSIEFPGIAKYYQPKFGKITKVSYMQKL